MSYITPYPRGPQPGQPLSPADPPVYSNTTTSTSLRTTKFTSKDATLPTSPTSSQVYAEEVGGQGRCYWTLLDTEFNFVSIDPVYTRDLGSQASVLLGRSLIEFMHPDERISARMSLDSKLKHKSIRAHVVRIRYSRLSRVRQQLGFPNPLPLMEYEKRLSSDSSYILVDLVANCVADGLILCFLHAAMDLDTVSDCDEESRSSWSNWCGTSAELLRRHINSFHQALSTRLPAAVSPLFVFQILDSSSQEPLLTWPYDRPGYVKKHHPPVHPFDLVKLAAPARHIHHLINDRSKTTCTRRFKSSQKVGTDRVVDSIFIPHGAVTFACHKISVADRSDVSSSSGVPPSGSRQSRPATVATPSQPPYTTGFNVQPYYTVNYSSYTGLPLQTHPHPPPTHSTPQWGYDGTSSSRNQYDPKNNASIASAAYSSTYDYTAANMNQPPSGSPPDQSPYTNKRRTSPTTTSRETYAMGARVLGNPPVGVPHCAECGTKTSPEWRKGPSGKKDLCNACGLRYARLKAKKEGIPTQRRRKETKPPFTSDRRVSPDSPGSVSPSSRPVELQDLGLLNPPSTMRPHMNPSNSLYFSPTSSPSVYGASFAFGGDHHHDHRESDLTVLHPPGPSAMTPIGNYFPVFETVREDLSPLSSSYSTQSLERDQEHSMHYPSFSSPQIPRARHV